MRNPGERQVADTTTPAARGASGRQDASSGVVGGDKRPVTVLFTDVSGYTAMMETLDPEDVRDVMSRIFGGIADIVSRNAGHVDKLLGDAALVIFGVPDVHEDDSLRAVRAALEIHDLVDRLGAELESQVGRRLRMHSGVATGVIIVTAAQRGREDSALGDAVNVASRLSDAAEAGEILVADECRRQTEGYFHFDDLGHRRVQGREQSVHVHRLGSPRSHPSTVHRLTGLRATLIGRRHELDALQQAYRRMEGGRGGFVAIQGEAGTGKSRLVEEFRASLDPGKVAWLRGNCRPSSQNVPYHPFAEMIAGAWGISDDDSSEVKREKIAQAVWGLGQDLEGAAPYIGSLFSLEYAELRDVDPEAWKDRTVAALRKLLATTASESPTVVYLGDLHWADPSTLEFLKAEASAEPQGYLWIWTCRSHLGFWPQTAGDNGFEVISLENLSPDDAQTMTASLLGTDAVPEELAAFVADKAEGNPFYLEEVVNSLVESGALVSDGVAWCVATSIADAELPLTVAGVVSARIDRLGHSAKTVVQEASVVGRRFPLAILERATRPDGDLMSVLALLVDSGLVRRSEVDAESHFEFRHALVQEVAYGSLIRAERQAIHERVGRAYEEAYADRLPQVFDQLGHHFSRGTSIQKAVGYLVKSGRRAFDEFAIGESDEYYREAYELLANTAANRQRHKMIVGLLSEWSYVLHTKGDLRRLESVLAANRDAADSLGPTSENASYRTSLGIALWCQECFPEAEDQLLSALRMAEDLGDERLAALSSVWLSYVASELGRPDEAAELAERARWLLKPDPIYYTEALSALGFAHWTKSDAAGMQSVAEELLEYGTSRSNSRATAAGFWILGQARLAEGDSVAAATSFEESLRVSPDPWPSYYARMFLCAARVQEGRFEGVEDLLRDVIAFCDDHGAEMIASPARMLLGVTLFSGGDMASGMRLLEDVRSKWRSGHALMRYALVEVLLGNLFLEIVSSDDRVSMRTLVRNVGFLARNYRGAAASAEEHFFEALRVCDEVGDLQTAGEAYLGLSRLRAGTGDPIKAREFASRAVDCFERAGLETYLARSRELVESLS